MRTFLRVAVLAIAFLPLAGAQAQSQGSNQAADNALRKVWLCASLPPATLAIVDCSRFQGRDIERVDPGPSDRDLRSMRDPMAAGLSSEKRNGDAIAAISGKPRSMDCAFE